MSPFDVNQLRAQRLLRACRLVEFIAARPGYSRKELAHHWSFSERQMQADLNLIRDQFKLPLVRRQGYRFDDQLSFDQAQGRVFTTEDVQVLLALLARARADHGSAQVRSMLAALPSIMPLHLRPLVEVGVWAIGHNDQMFGTLAEAILTRSYVRLSYSLEQEVADHKPVVRPETILRFDEHWYLLGESRAHARTRAFPIEPLVAVDRVA
jgi:predicted DNA-binding transcriptional regulator YafY